MPNIESVCSAQNSPRPHAHFGALYEEMENRRGTTRMATRNKNRGLSPSRMHSSRHAPGGAGERHNK
ncbi:hypothetical protein NDU88_004778 [Pleurodeles waltl]|uniref:Uncharacterized protein n=1 Tax=Pleurodeles waltl TaxID=8319 RepID=A0AAV7MAV7_PLEWA|nr:hypothetical protein NDU88_004778 [Pleurodeles waltl]